MKPAINKYKRQQQQADADLLDRSKANALLAEVVDEDESSKYEDKLFLSEAAAEKIAQEALDEDEDIVLELTALPVTASTSAAGASVSGGTNVTTTGSTDAKPREKEKLGSRDEIIVEFAPLIKYIAQKIAARLPANIELDDLMSSGVIGLMDAIDKYDPSRDNKFKTYAEFRIRGAILDELRAQDWVPRSVREKAKMLERVYVKIEQDKGRPADDDEICAELKITKEEYHELLAEVRSISLLSYDDLNNLSKGDRRGSIEFSESAKAPTPYSEVNTAAVKKLVAEAINELPEKQRLVLSLYYYEDLNLKEIGKVLDVTESRVSQLHTQAILKLKAKLKGHFDEFLQMFM